MTIFVYNIKVIYGAEGGTRENAKNNRKRQ